MIDSSGWGLASDGTRFYPNSGKITGRVFAEIVDSSRDDAPVDSHEPVVEEASRACSCNDHSEVRQNVCLGGEIDGPFIV